MKPETFLEQAYPRLREVHPWRTAVDRTGMETVEVSDELVLGADGVATAWAVVLLRECAGHGVAVDWTASVAPSFDMTVLHHLCPPRRLTGTDAAALANWRRTYRHGAYYYRQGPGFVQVKDVRDVAGGARLTISGDWEVDLFLRCLTPLPWTDLPASEHETVSQFVAEHLVLDTAGTLVTLPPRMRHWPVPIGLI